MRGFLVALALTSTVAAQQPAALREVTQAEIDRAIDKGVAHQVELYTNGARRDPLRPLDLRPFPSIAERPGLHALTLYTLLQCGADPRHPVIEKLVARVAKLSFRETYDVACLLLALVAYDADAERAWIDELAAWLVATRNATGDWGYPGGGDLSNTQYAALGLRAAAIAGYPVPPRVWSELALAVLRYRTRDGGFCYVSAENGATPAMTAAGVGTLAICEIELAKLAELDASLAEKMQRARAAGLEWLGKNGDVDRDCDHIAWLHYYLYGLERVGALSGVERIGACDWYRSGARYLVDTQDARGDWPGTFERVPALFALLFLRRATAPHADLPRTGPPPQRLPHTEGTDVAGALKLEAQGTRPIRMWLRALVSPRNAPLEWPGERGRGPRVLRVEYRCDGATIACAVGDPERPAGDQRYVCECRTLTAGHHRIVAEVHVRLPPGPAKRAAGELAPFDETVVTSNAIDVEIVDDAPPAERAPPFVVARDLVLRSSAHAKASSTQSRVEGFEPGELDSSHAIDANPRTAWIASPQDAEPRLVVTLQQAQRADRVRIAMPRFAPRDPEILTRPERLLVSIDAEKPRTFEVRDAVDGWIVVPLEKTATVRQIEVRLVGREDPTKSVGIAEVVLEAAKE